MSETPSVKEVSESSFEYLLAEILTRWSSKATSSENQANNDACLDKFGFDIGYRFAEKIASQQKTLGSDQLNCVKFLCKDFWEEMFKKKMDKLQTNHRGVYVLSDYKFKWLEKYASDDPEAKAVAGKLVHYLTCGILRGALANLGLTTNVTAEFTTLVHVSFHVRVRS